MPKGDYGQGTTLRPHIVNVTLDKDLVIDHVGIGYTLTTPSGRLHDSGYTWHSPKGDYAHAPSEHIEKLQEVMLALLQAAADYEGAELTKS